MMTPEDLISSNILGSDIMTLVDKLQNDQELGAAVRKRIGKYREDKGKPPFTEDYTQ
jgi:hypothetical protein